MGRVRHAKRSKTATKKGEQTMPQLEWNFLIKTSDGLQSGIAGNVKVDATGKIEKTLSAPSGGATSTTTKVEVQPGDTDKMEALIIYSNKYDDGITYTVSDETGDGAADVPLDGPQILIGQGAVGLLQKAPKTIEFVNTLTQDVTVTIVVGRLAS
jgi:hypothetical protein